MNVVLRAALYPRVSTEEQKKFGLSIHDQQNDLRDTVTKFHIIQGAHTYRGSIALALTDRLVGRAIAGQAADELLNIAGIEASFVLFPEAGQAYLSARSNSDVNVQVISEMLGGGGNAATAGAQFPDSHTFTVSAL